MLTRVLVVILISSAAAQTGFPKFDEEDEDVVIAEGSKAAIRCNATGDLPMTYKWHDEGNQPISSERNNTVYFVSEPDGSDLIFRRAEFHHTGLYICSARNSHGLASKLYNVDVRHSGLPVFDPNYEEVTLRKGVAGVVWCNATGDEPINYSWHDDTNQEIYNDTNYSLYSSFEPHGSGLVFNVTEYYHSGIYVCSARNTYGQVSKVYNVTIRHSGNETDNGDDDVLIYVDIQNVTESSVTFYLTVIGDPQFYYVTYTEKLEKIRHTMKVPATDLIKISGLIPSGRYEFQFNGSFWGNYSLSRVYEVILLPDIPEVIYRSLGSGTVKISWFSKTDDFFRDTIDAYKVSYSSVSQMRGNYWIYNDCATEVYKPKCTGSIHTITGLSNQYFYEIRVMAHTKAGYGKPYRFKVFLE